MSRSIDEPDRALCCAVSGRVQGVWYRASTARQAEKLSLRGWAKNLADGDVEVVVAGKPGAVAELCAWLWKGPSGARVTGVDVKEWSDPVAGGFRIL